MSNGQRSKQRDDDVELYYDHMFPADLNKMIRSVDIHYYSNHIYGFSFYDKEGALLWKIGSIQSWMYVGTLLIADNELIVGVAAKLYPGYQSCYTDFQFQIASRD